MVDQVDVAKDYEEKDNELALKRHFASIQPVGPDSEVCMACGEPIPEARRLALPGTRFCVSCQQSLDRRAAGRGVARVTGFIKLDAFDKTDVEQMKAFIQKRFKDDEGRARNG